MTNHEENFTIQGWENDEYNAFVEKFKRKKTTDDCYTPPLVYAAVEEYVSAKYGLNKADFVRPFYPGGDYKRFRYAAEAVVVDNPPFSILTEIRRFYSERKIRFFLFAPALTMFSPENEGQCFLPVGATITYENGAEVCTSFVTNLEPENLVRCDPKLYKAVDRANKENTKANKTETPVYTYPNHVITAAICQRWCRYGVPYTLKRGSGAFVNALDSQRANGKSIFGGGFLLTERAAAERAAAERAAAERAAAERVKAWQLSDREMLLVEHMSIMEARE